MRVRPRPEQKLGNFNINKGRASLDVLNVNCGQKHHTTFFVCEKVPLGTEILPAACSLQHRRLS